MPMHLEVEKCSLWETPASIILDKFAPFPAILALLLGVGMQAEVKPAMTVRDVANFLNVNEKTIYRLVTKGDLTGFKVLGSWRFQQSDLVAWIDSKKTESKSFTKDGKDLNR
jgi:excisionase family DNA binding protein